MSTTIDTDAIILSLAHLIGCKDDCKLREADKIHFLNHTFFDGFEHVEFGHDDILIPKDAKDTPVWPLDVSLVTSAGSEGWEPGSLQFVRVRKLVPKDWRGKLHSFHPKTMEIAIMVTQPSGTKTSVRAAVLADSCGKMNVLAYGGKSANPTASPAGDGALCVDRSWYGGRSHSNRDNLYDTIYKIASGVALARRYNWSVLLSDGGQLSSRFVTDHIGILEVFKLRDIPEGKARREAIINWVSQHWRKKRDTTANDRTLIRTHLRGKVEYKWNGLHCYVEPPMYDLEKYGLL